MPAIAQKFVASTRPASCGLCFRGRRHRDRMPARSHCTVGSLSPWSPKDLATIAGGEIVLQHAAAEFQRQVAMERGLALFEHGDIAGLADLGVMEFAVG